MAAKDYVAARQLADQAAADAVLAQAKARSVRSDRALTELRESIQALQARGQTGLAEAMKGAVR